VLPYSSICSIPWSGRRLGQVRDAAELEACIGVFDTLSGQFAVQELRKEQARAQVEWLNARQRPVSPARAVEVWIDGEWCRAHLRHWSLEDAGWEGLVTLDGTSLTRWYPDSRLRPREERRREWFDDAAP
jgi:hypothetical protein